MSWSKASSTIGRDLYLVDEFLLSYESKSSTFIPGFSLFLSASGSPSLACFSDPSFEWLGLESKSSTTFGPFSSTN